MPYRIAGLKRKHSRSCVLCMRQGNRARIGIADMPRRPSTATQRSDRCIQLVDDQHRRILQLSNELGYVFTIGRTDIEVELFHFIENQGRGRPCTTYDIIKFLWALRICATHKSHSASLSRKGVAPATIRSPSSRVEICFSAKHRPMRQTRAVQIALGRKVYPIGRHSV